HRLQPFIARKRLERAILLPCQCAGRMEHRRQLVGISLIKTIEIGLRGHFDGVNVVAHEVSLAFGAAYNATELDATRKFRRLADTCYASREQKTVWQPFGLTRAMQISWWVELVVRPGCLDEFETLTGEMVASTRVESGVLAYQRFISEDRRTVYVYERYKDS